MTKTLQAHALRALTVSAAALAPASSQAALSLTIPTQFLEANAVQAFSEKAMQAFDAIQIVFSGKGNATAVPGATGPTGLASAYNLPVTSVSLQLIKISGGSATGSALEFLRLNDLDQVRQVTLANFRLDFVSKQILADATQNNQPTQVRTPIFDFREQTALLLKYRFPLSITAHQVLDQLFLTPEAKLVFINGLDLPIFAQPLLDSIDFGTITVDVAVKARKKPVSTKPYTPVPYTPAP
jgi:hypothetical protein